VKHCQHDNLVVCGAVEDGVREATQEDAADVAMNDRILLGRALKRVDRGLNSAGEGRA
jgi:hypothetical protein